MRFLHATAVLLCFTALVRADDVEIQPDIVYGHKDGLALTFDVLRPREPNGAAVLFLQSGGWYSAWVPPNVLVPASKPLLSKGFTVLIVRHGSAPRYAVPDAVADVRRCVRYVRGHAQQLKIDPERLGVLGGSAGGHLSLMLGTTGDDGKADDQDEVLRHGSRVAAVVALYPPTDIRTWVTDPPEAIKKIPALKPPLTFDAAKTSEVSPLLHVTAKSAPALMIHGDKDELVPISHSQQMVAAMEKEKVACRLLTIEGAAHGFSAKQNEIVVPAMVEWFEKHLAVSATTPAPAKP